VPANIVKNFFAPRYAVIAYLSADYKVKTFIFDYFVICNMLVNSDIPHFAAQFFHYFFLQVFIPNGTYNGQKLKRLVSRNIPAKTRRTIASVPVITFV